MTSELIKLGAPGTGANLMVFNHTILDYQSEFVRAMVNSGIIPTRDIFFRDFGEVVRFGVTGDKLGSKNGWAILFPGGRGVFGSWKLNMSMNWSADHIQNMTREERKRQLKELSEFKKKYEYQKIKRQNIAAQQCINIWDSAAIATDFSHQYLISKKIRAYGIRQAGKELLVPIQNAIGNLMNIQSINSSGIKKFHFGAAVGGNFMVIGELKGKIYIVEGYATGATIHELTGNSVVVAFSAGNLEKVVNSLRKVNAHLQLVIAADNDHFSLKNIGLSVATAIAKKFHIELVYPRFESWQIGSDFNDLVNYYPKAFVFAQLQGVD